MLTELVDLLKLRVEVLLEELNVGLKNVSLREVEHLLRK